MMAPGSHICSIVLIVSVGGLVAAATILTKTIVQISVYPQHIVVTMVMEMTARIIGGSIETTLMTSGVSLSQIPAVVEAPIAVNVRGPAWTALKA